MQLPTPNFTIKYGKVQVKVLNINDSVLDYAKDIVSKIEKSGFRVELDDRNEKIGKKIREAQLQKTPYMLVIGENEKAEGKVAVRHRKVGDLGAMSAEELIKLLVKERDSKEIK